MQIFEGFELEVLKGASETLDKVDLTILEMNRLSKLRSEGNESIYKLLINHDFIGPFKADLNKKRLIYKQKNIFRDNIFIAKKFINNLNNYG